MKNPFGGEPPLDQGGIHGALVHSGRAALRLILSSGWKSKRFLLPDFLCGIIIDVLREHRVRFAFYPVEGDLTPDWNFIKRYPADVLYIIHYFGQETVIPSWASNRSRPVISDGVFAPLTVQPQGARVWAAFNSLRKCTDLPEGALVISTRPLNHRAVSAQPAVFAPVKYRAKQLKADYFAGEGGDESGYLKLFNRAERALDRDRGAHPPSPETLARMPELFEGLADEQKTRRRQYALLRRLLPSYALPLKPRYFSFFVLDVPRRDELRSFLAKRRIYLPAHWPAPHGVRNPVYERILSIPLSSRYSDAQLREVALTIRGFLDGAARRFPERQTFENE